MLKLVTSEWQRDRRIETRRELKSLAGGAIARLSMTAFPVTAELGDSADNPLLLEYAIRPNGVELWKNFGLLVVRMLGVDNPGGEPCTVVTIDSNGFEKLRGPRGLSNEAIFAPLPARAPLPANAKEIYVVVGWPEAATIHEAVESALTIYVYAPHHLPEVGKVLHRRYAGANITFVLNAAQQPKQAVEVAKVVEGFCVLPQDPYSTFTEVRQDLGLFAVLQQLGARRPASEMARAA